MSVLNLPQQYDVRRFPFMIAQAPRPVTEAYVTIPNAGVVQIFSLQKGTLSATLNVGGNPRRVAFSQQGRIGAITNASGYISFVR